MTQIYANVVMAQHWGLVGAIFKSRRDLKVILQAGFKFKIKVVMCGIAFAQ